jgi:signal transduction histidine kinase
MAVFRIFQEMLSNVGRHARASRLGVHIVVRGTVLQLTVQDNGLGAPPQAFEAANAYGVMGMRERARHFGGDIQIDSAPGQGTRMCLTVTLPPGDPA